MTKFAASKERVNKLIHFSSFFFFPLFFSFDVKVEENHLCCQKHYHSFNISSLNIVLTTLEKYFGCAKYLQSY